VPAPHWLLLPLILLAEVLYGNRALSSGFLRGDLLYHSALASELLRGTYPLEGPYLGLPAYYPPGFHLLLAGTMRLTGLNALGAVNLLTILFMPVLPIGTFLLARSVTGRPWVALLAAAFTLFAGGLDFRAGRLWVDSLFIGGHNAWPIYPRDVAFGIIPFVLLAFLRAVDARRIRRAVPAAIACGVLAGVAGLVQVQMLVPIPVAMLVVAVWQGRRGTGRGGPAVVSVAVSAAVSVAVIAPWFLGQLDAIGASGGVALDSSTLLEPARFGLWSYPRQFGLVLPLAVVGAGTALLWLRRPDGPRPAGSRRGAWRPRPIAGGLLLVTWAGLAFGLAVLYSPDWPLEDALRPQRLWLLSSQPAAILAAIGTVVVVEEVAARRARPRWIAPAVLAVFLVVAGPATAATTRLVGGLWKVPAYAHLDLTADRVPDMGRLLGAPSPRQVIVTYEDWSSLVWYETGHAVLAVEPPGYAKLAFDPARVTGMGQEARRALIRRAFDGDLSSVTGVAEGVDAAAIVIAVDSEGGWALLDASARTAAAEPGAVLGPWTAVQGNGWDGVALDRGSRLKIATRLPAGAVTLRVRIVSQAPAPPAGTLVVRATGEDGSSVVRELPVHLTTDEFAVLATRLDVAAATDLELEVGGPFIIQSVRGTVRQPPLPPGWRLVLATPEAVVLRRTGG
jgi:hypothetical protein